MDPKELAEKLEALDVVPLRRQKHPSVCRDSGRIVA